MEEVRERETEGRGEREGGKRGLMFGIKQEIRTKAEKPMQRGTNTGFSNSRWLVSAPKLALLAADTSYISKSLLVQRF